MLTRNMKIVLSCTLLYTVIMAISVFWIIPTLISMLKLDVVWVLAISLGSIIIYGSIAIRLMLYLESKNKTVG